LRTGVGVRLGPLYGIYCIWGRNMERDWDGCKSMPVNLNTTIYASVLNEQTCTL